MESCLVQWISLEGLCFCKWKQEKQIWVRGELEEGQWDEKREGKLQSECIKKINWRKYLKNKTEFSIINIIHKSNFLRRTWQYTWTRVNILKVLWIFKRIECTPYLGYIFIDFPVYITPRITPRYFYHQFRRLIVAMWKDSKNIVHCYVRHLVLNIVLRPFIDV